jgi:glycosyltransferase involved in cell wall biosynthesis
MEKTRKPIVHFVIPCYNEAKRLDIGQYSTSLFAFPTLRLLFVNDGSSDDTMKLLLNLREKFPRQVEVLNLKTNKGKANAVRAGMYYEFEKNDELDCIGYLDADLATSIEEGMAISKILFKGKKTDFAFGSRISRVGSHIDRKPFRHLVGRVIATIISNILRLRVYDTQCGAKLFTKEAAKTAFIEPFISKWLFDVEIFARLLCADPKHGEEKMLEIPLKNWIDKEGSKVKITYFFTLFLDLYKIRMKYPMLKKRMMD